MRNFAQNRARLFTSTLVLAETYGLILIRRGRSEAQAFLDYVRQSTFQILIGDHLDFQRAEGILREYSDQNFSYVDATSLH